MHAVVKCSGPQGGLCIHRDLMWNLDSERILAHLCVHGCRTSYHTQPRRYSRVAVVARAAICILCITDVRFAAFIPRQ